LDFYALPDGSSDARLCAHTRGTLLLEMYIPQDIDHGTLAHIGHPNDHEIVLRRLGAIKATALAHETSGQGQDVQHAVIPLILAVGEQDVLEFGLLSPQLLEHILLLLGAQEIDFVQNQNMRFNATSWEKIPNYMIRLNGSWFVYPPVIVSKN